MDHRLKDLSYSSRLTLHSCPRKFELYRKNSIEIDRDGTVVQQENITFAFGHVVGEGIQEVLRSDNLDKAIFQMYLSWHADLFDSEEKRNKSFWLAIFAIQKFAAMRNSGYLSGYNLVYYNGMPATELSFCINLPNGFRYRGNVDAILQHKTSGKVLVLETKTSSYAVVNDAQFKNSAQAIGYSIVLDAIPELQHLSSYDVLYLVYLTKGMEYGEPLIFSKTFLQRALWIQELLLDIEIIELYDKTGVFPMHGQSCFDWYKQCEYYGLCTVRTSNISKPEPIIEDRKQEVFAITLTLNDLLQAQLQKTSHHNIETKVAI